MGVLSAPDANLHAAAAQLGRKFSILVKRGRAMRCMRAGLFLLAMAAIFLAGMARAEAYRVGPVGNPVGQSFYLACPDGEFLVGVDFQADFGTRVLEDMAAVCSKTRMRQPNQASPLPKGLSNPVHCDPGQFVFGIKASVKQVAGRPRIWGFHLFCRAPGGPIAVAWMPGFDSPGAADLRCRGNDFVKGIGGAADDFYVNTVALYCEDVPIPITAETLSVQNQPCGFCKKQVFANPTVNGAAMDVCLAWGTACGKPAADRFCTDRGFAESVAHAAQGNAPPTRMISDGKVCNETFCARLTSITCGRP